MYKIGVSGSAENNCAPGAYAKAREVGRQIALHKAVCVTGDTRGVPHAAVHGAKAAHGFTVGLSPAQTHDEHIKKYRLPDDTLDIVIYTGSQYSGRNLLFIRSCDAVIFICGRVGTLNEFTIAFEDNKPIGILTETGGMADEIQHLLDVSHRGNKNIFFDSDPKKLVKTIIDEIDYRECRREKNKNYCEIIKGGRK